MADQLGEPARFTIAAGDETQMEGVVSSLEHWEVTTRMYQIRRLGPEVYFKLRGYSEEMTEPVYDKKIGTKWGHGEARKIHARP